MSNTDALFTRFEGLFKKFLNRLLIVGFASQVSVDLEPTKRDLLRQFFDHSWDKKDPPSKKLLMEVVRFIGPPPIRGFEEVEDHVEESFALALEKLEIEEPKQDTKKGKECIKTFPSPPDLLWEEVSMAFISDQAIRVKARDQLKNFKFDQIGFEDKRSRKKPNRLWFFLQVFSARGGQLSWQDLSSTGMTANQVQSNVKRLRKILRNFMGIEDDPFEPYWKVKAYEAKFTITGDANALLNFEEDEPPPE